MKCDDSEIKPTIRCTREINAFIKTIDIRIDFFRSRTQDIFGDVIGVKEAIRTGTERGMLSFDSALYNLVREGRIELEEALSSADSRTNLEAKINFG